MTHSAPAQRRRRRCEGSVQRKYQARHVVSQGATVTHSAPAWRRRPRCEGGVQRGNAARRTREGSTVQRRTSAVSRGEVTGKKHPPRVRNAAVAPCSLRCAGAAVLAEYRQRPPRPRRRLASSSGPPAGLGCRRPAVAVTLVSLRCFFLAPAGRPPRRLRPLPCGGAAARPPVPGSGKPTPVRPPRGPHEVRLRLTPMSGNRAARGNSNRRPPPPVAGEYTSNGSALRPLRGLRVSGGSPHRPASVSRPCSPAHPSSGVPCGRAALRAAGVPVHRAAQVSGCRSPGPLPRGRTPEPLPPLRPSRSTANAPRWGARPVGDITPTPAPDGRRTLTPGRSLPPPEPPASFFPCRGLTRRGASRREPVKHSLAQ